MSSEDINSHLYEERCELGAAEKGLFSRSFPTLILEAIGRCRFLTFIEREPGVYVERKTSKIASTLLGYLCILGIYCLILLGVSISILGENYYLRFFGFLDPWEISWILLCATITCLVALVFGFLFYNSSHPIFLIVYISCLLVSFLFFVAALWTSAVFGQKLERTVDEQFINAINRYGLPDENTARRSVDDIQTHFQCCGLYNHSDWLFTPFYLTYTAWPDSCCHFRYKQVFCGDTFALIYQYQGCKESLAGHTRRVNNALIVTSSIAISIILIGCFLVILLFYHNKQKKS